ncbi:uncharacterized protein MELLADRAFT_84213 [Melampsora larici-populina 98AG31]|uniref:Uncharacterized protein n=1 Tax=Melampsora larici-populina (strain 98AG31 / pathotype 3-4-7) TaxID=747676 RepID=F4SBZ5_MELLP|nr:uncharacterized protein MELLADRAFT_84213 [Melampsora larici-populina 98AG31]EGF97834.1 hypothetical protein MELLADRAFT_84213 [Melampsora larici-populina 98AG31]
MSSSQDQHSDTIISPEPSSEPDPKPTQLQLDPSTLSQVLTGAITLAQTAGSSVSNKNKKSNSKMPRKLNATRAKPRSPRKSKSNKSKKTKTNNESAQNEDEKVNKSSQHWDKDDNGQGKSSMYLLINWLTEEENFGRFKDNKSEKKGVAEDIERYMIENGITWRSADIIRKKIGREEEAWRAADGLRNKTGQGSYLSATELKTAKGWADDDPEWLKVKKVAIVSDFASGLLLSTNLKEVEVLF